MLSKGKVKYIHSLEMKKYRNELNAFVAEGNKLVADMMFAFECELILAKPSWMAMQGNIPAKELLEAEGDDIRKASFLKNPQDVLAVFKRPDWSLDEADPSYALPTGSASNISFAAPTPQMSSVRRLCRPQWAHWHM